MLASAVARPFLHDSPGWKVKLRVLWTPRQTPMPHPHPQVLFLPKCSPCPRLLLCQPTNPTPSFPRLDCLQPTRLCPCRVLHLECPSFLAPLGMFALSSEVPVSWKSLPAGSQACFSHY